MVERLDRMPRAKIIGSGDIASALEGCGKENMTFFASGVSNSQETRESEYQREKDLLLAQDKSEHLVYFGSLCIFYSETRYAQHKREMEDLVRENFERYTIIRLGNITWGTNTRTIINYFRGRMKEGKPLEIQDAYRYVVGKEEFQHWIGMIPSTFSCEMNVPGRRMRVVEIVNEIEQGRL